MDKLTPVKSHLCRFTFLVLPWEDFWHRSLQNMHTNHPEFIPLSCVIHSVTHLSSTSLGLPIGKTIIDQCFIVAGTIIHFYSSQGIHLDLIRLWNLEISPAIFLLFQYPLTLFTFNKSTIQRHNCESQFLILERFFSN